MPLIIKNANLQTYNTFGLSVEAKELAICKDVASLKETIKYLNNHPMPYLILGGGSNLLFSKDYEGLIIHPEIMGIEKIKEDDKHVWIEAGAGVEWDNLVNHSVINHWYGLENLSYIPGNVGASPVQNIGAYGVEVKDTIHLVKGLFIGNGKPFEMENTECEFGYRDSIFKRTLKNTVIITSVVYKLNKNAELNLSYGPVKEEVAKKGDITIKNLRDTIIEIRKSKLPEPSEIGNAGSFFKNPVISGAQYTRLSNTHPNIPGYRLSDDLVKVPAGWLIETAGWKGKSHGGAAVHKKQALVLINENKASASDIINLAKMIINDIDTMFGITLEPEVNIV